MKNKLFGFSDARGAARPWSCVIVNMVMMLTGVSCEKMNVGDQSQGDGLEQANVVVRVASFEQIPFPDRTRAVALGDVSTRLNVAVYDHEGARVAQVNQREGDEHFGQVGFRLPAGHYFLVALAHNCAKNPTMTNAQTIRFSNQKTGIGYSDTFLYGDSVVVGDEPVERVMTMRRIVAKVRFEFDDTPPADANRIRFLYEGGSGTFDAATGWGVVKSKQVQFYDLDSEARAYEIYTIPRADEGFLTVTANTYLMTDNDTTVMSERRIDSIPITRNRITVCRGSLFGDETVATRAQTFSFAVENDWEEGQTIFF